MLHMETMTSIKIASMPKEISVENSLFVKMPNANSTHTIILCRGIFSSCVCVCVCLSVYVIT